MSSVSSLLKKFCSVTSNAEPADWPNWQEGDTQEVTLEPTTTISMRFRLAG
jgi:hypothetical protein